MATKAITLENLGTYRTQIETVVDNKIAASGGNIEFATEQDILDLFSDAGTEA